MKKSAAATMPYRIDLKKPMRAISQSKLLFMAEIDGIAERDDKYNQRKPKNKEHDFLLL